MLKPVKLFPVLLLLPMFFIFSCSKDDGENGSETGSFDREELLINWADNIIIPSFENFSGVTENLQEETQQFSNDPSVANLISLRQAYAEGYIQFQTVSVFSIGKAENINYRSRLNTYPTKISDINGAINAGQFNLELPSTFDEQGFPALDYLLNGIGETDEEIVNLYSSHPNSETYKEYLTAVSGSINSLTQEVLEDWKSGFRESFVSNTSSSRTGSVDRFTNEYVLYYERFLRSGKIGFPSGIFTGNPVPENVEAFYSRSLSKELYLKALETVQNLFNGKHFNSNQTGSSFKQYLDYQNAIKGSEDLGSLINSQFNAIKSQAANLNPDFVQQVKSNNNVMLEAFDELQKNVVLLKVDMMQALSISVDYVDSDGD